MENSTQQSPLWEVIARVILRDRTGTDLDSLLSLHRTTLLCLLLDHITYYEYENVGPWGSFFFDNIDESGIHLVTASELEYAGMAFCIADRGKNVPVYLKLDKVENRLNYQFCIERDGTDSFERSRDKSSKELYLFAREGVDLPWDWKYSCSGFLRFARVVWSQTPNPQ